MEGQDLATRVENLFASIRHPGTGEPYTNAEVARMSAGGITEEDVGGIRSGAIPTRPWDRPPRLRLSSACRPPTSWTGARGAGSGPGDARCYLRRDGRSDTQRERPPAGEGEADRAWDSAGIRGQGSAIKRLVRSAVAVGKAAAYPASVTTWTATRPVVALRTSTRPCRGKLAIALRRFFGFLLSHNLAS
jgi:hypothetical protein